MLTTELLSRVFTGTLPAIINELDYKTESADLEALDNLVSEFPKLMENAENFKLVFRVLSRLEQLNSYIKWIENTLV
jgi:hypothetical protein